MHHTFVYLNNCCSILTQRCTIFYLNIAPYFTPTLHHILPLCCTIFHHNIAQYFTSKLHHISAHISTELIYEYVKTIRLLFLLKCQGNFSAKRCTVLPFFYIRKGRPFNNLKNEPFCHNSIQNRDQLTLIIWPQLWTLLKISGFKSLSVLLKPQTTTKYQIALLTLEGEITFVGTYNTPLLALQPW